MDTEGEGEEVKKVDEEEKEEMKVHHTCVYT